MRSRDTTARPTRQSKLTAGSNAIRSTGTVDVSNTTSNSINDDSESIFSAGTTITLESFQALEGRITTLQSQLLEEKQRSGQQFEQIMLALQNINSGKNDQSLHHRVGDTMMEI